MTFDRNPKFGRDRAFSESARRAADLLWGSTKGDLTAFPPSYLENLRHDFTDGKVSMLELIDRVDLGPGATYEDYCEVVNTLMCVEPTHWPESDSVVSVSKEKLAYEIEETYQFSESDFAESGQDPDLLSDKMELFLKKIIASVYLDGVTAVTDVEGNPPSEANNYLMSADGKQFSGKFFDSYQNEAAKSFDFVIAEKPNGLWEIDY